MINMVLGTKMRALNAPARVLFVALFVMLLLFGTTLGLMHVHVDGTGHTDCALCQSVHNIARPSSVLRICAVAFVTVHVILPARREYREHLFSYSHWNRPPPGQTAIA
jgi:hypothetical protein